MSSSVDLQFVFETECLITGAHELARLAGQRAPGMISSLFASCSHTLPWPVFMWVVGISTHILRLP